MPMIGANGLAGGPSSAPKYAPPKPPPPPARSGGFVGAVAHAISNVGTAVSHAAAPVAKPAPAQSGRLFQSSPATQKLAVALASRAAPVVQRMNYAQPRGAGRLPTNIFEEAVRAAQFVPQVQNLTNLFDPTVAPSGIVQSGQGKLGGMGRGRAAGPDRLPPGVINEHGIRLQEIPLARIPAGPNGLQRAQAIRGFSNRGLAKPRNRSGFLA